MVSYTTLKKDILEYVRNKLRNDSNLCVTILGMSGTTDAINHIFIKRPADEKLNPSGQPNFKLPRIVIDLVGEDRGFVGTNLAGFYSTSVDVNISFWVTERPWDLSVKASDRIENLFEDDTPEITNGFGHFKVLFSDDIQDPDRTQTRMGSIRIRASVQA